MEHPVDVDRGHLRERAPEVDEADDPGEGYRGGLRQLARRVRGDPAGVAGQGAVEESRGAPEEDARDGGRDEDGRQRPGGGPGVEALGAALTNA